MSLLSKNRAFLPACLMLGALLCSLPALAQSPPAPADTVPTQRLLLQHTVPSEILKFLHWDQAANLPAGVTQIIAQPDTNSLSVIATPASFEKIREIIKALDVAPREVQIKLALAHTTTADLMTQSNPTRLLQMLTSDGTLTKAPVITTTNNVSAYICVTTASSATAPVVSDTYTVTPHINDDGSVTLAFHVVLVDGAAKREINTTRSIKSGDTIVLVMPSDAQGEDDKNLVLFVTPTVLPDAGHATPKK